MSSFDSEIKNYIESIIVDVQTAAHKTVEQAGQFGVEQANNTKLFHNDGALAAATHFVATSDYSGFVVADKSYAIWLEEGNNQFGEFITPKNKKALHFFAHGEEVFTKKVKTHSALPFMSDAAELTEKEIENIWLSNFHKE